MKKIFHYVKKGFVVAAILAALHVTIDAVASYSDRREVAFRAFPGTQVMQLRPEQGRSGGTGFAVRAPSGAVFVLTNAHICGLSATGRLRARSDTAPGRDMLLSVIEVSKTDDLCLLTLPAPFAALDVGHVAPPETKVVVVGHPLLESVTRTAGYITGYGMISVNLRAESAEECAAAGGRLKEEADPFLGLFTIGICLRDYAAGRVTALAYPGNSGSPVINQSNEVVGVLFAADSEMHLGYIVPLPAIQQFLERY